MKPHTVSVLALVGAVVSFGIVPRDPMDAGLLGTCPVVPTLIVQVQPLYYSGYIPYNTVVDLFRDGNSVTVSNAPTVISVTSALTTTIYPSSASATAASVASTSENSSAGAAATSAATSSLETSSELGSTSSSKPIIYDIYGLTPTTSTTQTAPTGACSSAPDWNFALYPRPVPLDEDFRMPCLIHSPDGLGYRLAINANTKNYTYDTCAFQLGKGCTLGTTNGLVAMVDGLGLLQDVYFFPDIESAPAVDDAQWEILSCGLTHDPPYYRFEDPIVCNTTMGPVVLQYVLGENLLQVGDQNYGVAIELLVTVG